MNLRTGLLSLLFTMSACMTTVAMETPQLVAFPAGESATAIRDRLSGEDSTSYSLEAKKGQTLNVRLATDNSSNYFNIRREGADGALFIGSQEGRPAALKITQDGMYLIDVYLMRSAARRGESARFTLNVAVE
ncbi:DNA breaking-rejoining protein [Limoniibacter endophyticus]|uniref:DNA breaking-rejoining protein n=1 Tax=Limoniibacter endophyticus TaxID=1565040 RepID=A0A8J3GGJ3_9HYPH|nr:DNA breaking-rejoining protein [Limoniibacter endophyticus]GHC65757.1 DNA breaking-rejoining protein [Limoniibacter endophyticus]